MRKEFFNFEIKPRLGKADFLLIFLIVLFSVVIRQYLFPSNLACDEGIYRLEAESINISEYYTGKISQLNHGPVFYYLLKFFGLFGNSIFLLRLPSIIFSTLLVFSVYLFVSTFFNRTIAFFSSFILLVSPIFNSVSIYASPHMIFSFFSLCSLLLLVYAFESSRRGYLIASFAFAALAILTMITGVITIASIILSLIIVKNPFFSIKKKFFSKSLFLAFIAYFIILLLIFPPFLMQGKVIKKYLFYQNLMISQKEESNKDFLSADLINSIWNTEKILRYFLILGLFFLFLIPLTEREKPLSLLLIYSLLNLFMMSFTTGSYVYAISSVVIMHMFSVIGFLIVMRGIKNHEIILAIFFAFLAAVFLLNIHAGFYEKSVNELFPPLYSDTFEYIRKDLNNSKVISSCSGLIDYYADNESFNVTVRDFDDNLNFKNLRIIPKYVIFLNQPPFNQLKNDSAKYNYFMYIEEKCVLDTAFLKNVSKENAALLIWNCSMALK